jgi:CDP-glucose 4,6-dehydratase
VGRSGRDHAVRDFFGPGDTNWDRFVPATIRSVLEGRRPDIRSDGTPTRDYLYVVDGALAYLCLAEALTAERGLAGEAFNFSTEQPVSVLDLTEMIQKAAGTSFAPVVLGTAANEIAEQRLSAEKARRVLRWQPGHSLEEALAETVAWYRAYLAA